MPRGRLLHTILAGLAALLLAVGANMLAERWLGSARLDVTEQRLHSLSAGTREVLAGIEDPITLQFYFSRRLGAELPAFGLQAGRVRDMLREYVAASGGRLRLEVFDPEPFSEAEDRALAAGLQGVPLDQGGDQVFFGLAARNLLDEDRVIPFFPPEREAFLEADLTRLVFELSSPERPVLGVMSPLPLMGDPRALMMRQPRLAQPVVVMRQLRETYQVQEVPADAQAIPPEVGLLLVAHPQGLSEVTQYAIDQFVMRGGRLLLLLDPHSETQATRPGPDGRAPTDTASRLDRLLHAWGVEAPADEVVLDQRGAWRVRAPGQQRVQAVDYLAWFNLQGDSLDRTDIATALLQQVTLASAGRLRPRAGSEVEFIPLLTSSAQSMLADAARVRQDPQPVRLLAEFAADEARHVIAARLRGRLASAFPDGPPPLPEGVERAADLPEHRAASDGVANLVVIHDTDILADSFWVQTQEFFGQQVLQPFSGNGGFVVNIVDTLAGSDALIGLRSRGEVARPFERVEAIRRRAEAEFRQSEQALQERLQATERRLTDLRQGSGATPGAAPGQIVITPELRAEIEAAQAEIAATRQQLRGVQRDLRAEIDSLHAWLRALNIAAVPLLLVGFAMGLALLRARRRAAARA